MDKDEFENCQTSNGKPLTKVPTSDDVIVNLNEMNFGSNYFICKS